MSSTSLKDEGPGVASTDVPSMSANSTKRPRGTASANSVACGPRRVPVPEDPRRRRGADATRLRDSARNEIGKDLEEPRALRLGRLVDRHDVDFGGLDRADGPEVLPFVRARGRKPARCFMSRSPSWLHRRHGHNVDRGVDAISASVTARPQNA